MKCKARQSNKDWSDGDVCNKEVVSEEMNGYARMVARLTQGHVAGLYKPNAFLISSQNLLCKGMWVALRERPVHI